MSYPIQSAGQIGTRVGLERPLGAGLGAETSPAGGASFKDTLSRALGDVQELQDDAGGVVEAFLRGEPVELHDVMAAVEEAGIALEMLIEVRDRLIEAYRTVVNMQT